VKQHRPSTKQKGRRRKYPPAYRKALVKARTRVERRRDDRPINPGLRLVKDEDSGQTTWGPVFKGDDELWWLMLCDAFGTVSDSILSYFVNQLIELSDGQRPDETTVNAAIGIIGSFKPKTEAEAMLAAQMVAVHTLTMKAAGYAGAHGQWHVPERETKLVFRGARAFAEQAEVMARLKGRRSRQDIHVHQHYYDHRQVVDGDLHIHQGGDDFGAPTRGPNIEGTEVTAEILPASKLAISPPVRRGDEAWHPLPSSGDQEPCKVPLARLRSGRGRSEGQGERRLQARGLDPGGEGVASATRRGDPDVSSNTTAD
jgi:hypothetical protein